MELTEGESLDGSVHTPIYTPQILPLRGGGAKKGPGVANFFLNEILNTRLTGTQPYSKISILQPKISFFHYSLTKHIYMMSRFLIFWTMFCLVYQELQELSSIQTRLSNSFSGKRLSTGLSLNMEPWVRYMYIIFYDHFIDYVLFFSFTLIQRISICI